MKDESAAISFSAKANQAGINLKRTLNSLEPTFSNFTTLFNMYLSLKTV